MAMAFGEDLVAKTNQARVSACKAQLDKAIKASEDLEVSVRWLVKERAWEVLGYPNLSEMWEAHAGFKCPTYVKAIAVDAFSKEGMNTPGFKKGNKTNTLNGHRSADVARAVGLAVYSDKNDHLRAPAVMGMLQQINAGVPLTRVSQAQARKTISKYGSRQHPRRTAAAPDELVAVSCLIPRKIADEVAEIARKADVPNTEIYRQAVAEYLIRHKETHNG